MAAPSSERWAAIAPVLDAALDLAPERRPAFLAERCANDPGLRFEVEQLLAAAESVGSFLAESASVFASPLMVRVARQEVLAPGDRLGAYRIERDIGRGGMATVYLAQDTRHGRLVALKVLDRELCSTLGADRFIRETAFAARLNHPHILPLFDSGLVESGDGSVLYYAMPYVDGRSLRERLREEPRLPIDAAVAIACQVAEALGHAHQHGVIHRDIKPENVLLAGEHAFVADFGIALALDAAGDERLTRTGLSLGTPAYMSPEQATTGRLDGRSDLYSLGCMLYEMLAGQPPFSGSTPRSVLTRHAVLAVPPLRTFRPAVPPALERVIARCLAKAPEDRFPDGHAVAEALSRAATTTPTPADTAYSFVVRALYAIRRRRALSAALAGLVVLGVGLALKAHSGRAAAPALDRGAVAVAPFRVSSANTSFGYLREGVVDLLAQRLGGTERLHPVDAPALLHTWRRMSGSGGDPSESQALELASRLGAGRLIEGEVVGAGAHLTISASMLDVASHTTLARETIEGSVDSLPPMLDRLASRLLAIEAGQNQARLASLTATPLAAVRSYLNGEMLDRQGLSDSAAKSFQEALRLDSTFALAAMRLAGTSPWPDVSSDAKETAWRHRDRLSVPDRAELTAMLGPRYPLPSTQREGIAAAEHLVQVAPQNPRAWLGLGIGLFDQGPLLALPEAQARAAVALARAVALDSTSVPALGGLIIATAALGDTVTARKALARLRRQQRDSTSRTDFDLAWFLASVTADTAALRRVLQTAGTSPPSDGGASGWSMIRLGLHQGLSLRGADRVLDRGLMAAATEDQRSSIRWAQIMLDGISGRSSQRPPGLPAIVGKAPESSPIFDFLFADGDSAGWDKAGDALLRQIGSRRADQCCIPRFGAGEYALATNRLDLAERAARDLRSYHGPSLDADSAFSTAVSYQYGMILEAQIAARRHDPSAAARLRQLDSLLADPLDSWTPSLGNLVAAQLHEARGELAAALSAVRRRDWDHVSPYYVVYHREEGRLAALTGDTAAAILAYRRYLALRSDAEPKLQPRVRQVRSALAALEHAVTTH